MEPRNCAHCGKPFVPHPHVPNQTFCSSPNCQRARKRQWQQTKLQTDPAYRTNQHDAQRAWLERHPNYWQNYRESKAEPTQPPIRPVGNHDASPAKMDVCDLPSGVYRIRRLSLPIQAPDGHWLIEITPVCLNCPCKKDVCKEMT